MFVRLHELQAFVAVADHLNFQRAALERGVTRSALSHSVRSLERTLGLRLLQRNTRSVSLSDAGSILYARLKPAFRDIAQALDEVNCFRDTPSGTVRLTVPKSIGASLLAPIVARLVRENPSLSIEVSSSDALVDIVAEGFDAGIRFGERLHQDMIAVRIAFPMAFAVVASPDYFAEKPAPVVPHDLLDHRCIRYRFPSRAMMPWEFERDGEIVSIDVPGAIALDDQEMMVATALSGGGIAFVFDDRVGELVQAGKLVRCLADWTPEFSDLFLYYADRSFVPAGLRVLIDALKKPRQGALAG